VEKKDSQSRNSDLRGTDIQHRVQETFFHGNGTKVVGKKTCAKDCWTDGQKNFFDQKKVRSGTGGVFERTLG